MQPINSRVALFEEIFHSTKDRLFGFIKGILHDDTKVQDCMQQCYMKLWEMMDTIDTDKDILPLLYTYSRNLSIDSLRRNARYVWVDNLSVFSEQFRESNYAEINLNRKESARELQELMRQMPPRRREVFRLIKLQGLTYREAAEQMNIAVSTVEKHMIEAYKFLSRESALKLLLVLALTTHHSLLTS